MITAQEQCILRIIERNVGASADMVIAYAHGILPAPKARRVLDRCIRKEYIQTALEEGIRHHFLTDAGRDALRALTPVGRR